MDGILQNDIVQWIIVGFGVLFIISILRAIILRKKIKGQANAKKEQSNKAKQQQIEKEIIKDKAAEKQRAEQLPSRKDKKKAIQELRELESRDKRLEKEELKAT